MNNWWKNQTLLLKVILCVLLSIILILIIAIVISFNHSPTQFTPEEESLRQFEIRSEAYEIFSKEGLEEMKEYYDSYEKDVHTTDEKKAFLGNKVINYHSVCGWACSDEILQSIHSLYDLAPESVEQYQLCYYEDLYVDQDPIEACNRQQEGYYSE